jgi:hypothetical protein
MSDENVRPERHFKVILSERQHEIVEIALRTLSTDDPDAAAENTDTLAAFLDTTEEVR